ncbi:CLUMA_CG010414, isoform A [Clunio marinus]|uniref:CLUMA_CG010414, isoform A n=1 Tax=Clunio marinus TaxID=568069 RepID=A0A1J1IDF5_9DIPT|nr:CLUMA_CG010414, isoform A [Clunio marinus]
MLTDKPEKFCLKLKLKLNCKLKVRFAFYVGEREVEVGIRWKYYPQNAYRHQSVLKQISSVGLHNSTLGESHI